MILILHQNYHGNLMKIKKFMNLNYKMKNFMT
jgi:hypothetical protein